MILKKLAKVSAILLMGFALLGCQKTFQGDQRLNLESSEGCASEVANLFGVPREDLVISRLSYNINSVSAQTTGSRLLFTLIDGQGALDISFNAPRAGLVQTVRAESYTIQYRCVENDCFRLAFLITQTQSYSSGVGFMESGTAGFVLQQDGSRYAQICATGDSTL